MNIFIRPITENPTAQIAIMSVLILICLDFIAGFSGALLTKSVSSKRMREGILHKFMEIVLMALATVIDGALLGGFDILDGNPVLVVTCGYLALMEVISVLEIIGRYNPDIAEDNPILGLVQSKEKEE